MNRKKSETITIRVSTKEKELLKKYASERNCTITEYIIRTAIGAKDTSRFLPIVTELALIKNELMLLQQKKNTSEICDIIEKQKEAFDEAISALKRIM